MIMFIFDKFTAKTEKPETQKKEDGPKGGKVTSKLKLITAVVYTFSVSCNHTTYVS